MSISVFDLARKNSGRHRTVPKERAPKKSQTVLALGLRKSTMPEMNSTVDQFFSSRAASNLQLRNIREASVRVCRVGREGGFCIGWAGLRKEAL
jgi:hypothetical protein